MACITPFTQSQAIFKKPQLSVPKRLQPRLLNIPSSSYPQSLNIFARKIPCFRKMAMADSSSSRRTPVEAENFVEEMRLTSMRLHPRDLVNQDQKEATIGGYLAFLVDSKLIFDTHETLMEKTVFPEYAQFKDTGLERSERLDKDLEWFKGQGYCIPETSGLSIRYAKYLEILSEKDPQAFICHFYNTYFAHSAGGRTIGKKVAAHILNNKELEFYKWNGDVSILLQNVKDNINEIAKAWTVEQKNHCLEETEKAFSFSVHRFRMLLS